MSNASMLIKRMEVPKRFGRCKLAISINHRIIDACGWTEALLGKVFILSMISVDILTPSIEIEIQMPAIRFCLCADHTQRKQLDQNN